VASSEKSTRGGGSEGLGDHEALPLAAGDGGRPPSGDDGVHSHRLRWMSSASPAISAASHGLFGVYRAGAAHCSR